MSKQVVAIVGRPNVGKSTIFNALLGERRAIVDDSPGLTRDRNYAEISWFNHDFVIVDTGGIELSSEDDLFSEMRIQANLAILHADVIIFVVDALEGLQDSDREIAVMLRKSNKKLILAVNKCDRPGEMEIMSAEFYELGIFDLFAISASHRLGLGEMIDQVILFLDQSPVATADDEIIKVALIGKPNAGKSSLLNYLLGEDRSIVSNIPGTTRDAIDASLENEHGSYSLIDTAGLRRKSKIDNRIEKYSVLRTEMAINRADVCLIMVDANEGVSEQDTKVAGLAHNSGKASIIIVNKWDLIEKDQKTFDNFRNQVLTKFAFMKYAPILFISALTGQRINRLFPLINQVFAAYSLRIKTGVLNEVLAESVAMTPTPQKKGKQLKIYYMTQVATRPPQFALFINNKDLAHFSYERYLENQLRRNFELEGSPINLYWRSKKDQKDD